MWRLLCCFGVGDETPQPRRPWAELPDLVVYSIFIRLTSSLRDLAAFRGACSAWRSCLSGDSPAILDEFLKRHHQPMKNFEVVPSPPPSSTSSSLDVMSWYVKDRPERDTDSLLIRSGLEDGTFILKNRNATRDSHGIKVTLAKPSFDFAYRTGLLTSPNCLLVIISGSLIQLYPIAAAAPFRRVVKEFPEGIIPQQPGHDMLSSVIVSMVAFKDRLYVAGCRGRVVEVKMFMNDDDDDDDNDDDGGGGGGGSCSFSRREIWLEESREAYPVLGASKDGKLLMFREDEKKVYQFDSSTEKWEEMPQVITFTGSRRMPQTT